VGFDGACFLALSDSVRRCMSFSSPRRTVLRAYQGEPCALPQSIVSGHAPGHHKTSAQARSRRVESIMSAETWAMTQTKWCRALRLAPAPLVDKHLSAFCQPVQRGRTRLRLLSIGSRLSSGAAFSPGLKERCPLASQYSSSISMRTVSPPLVVKPTRHSTRKAPGEPGAW